jgi:type VI secretion system protein ImpA
MKPDLSPTVDFDRLMTPISEKQQSGQFLRNEGTYEAIKEARRQDDDFDQGAWVVERKRADWPRVIRICLDALYTRTKDLRIAASLLEALIAQKSIAGAAEGLGALNHLCEGFWDNVYPGSPEGEGLGERISVFEWINHKLSLRLKFVPITAPANGEYKWQTYSDYERVLSLKNALRKDPRAKTPEAASSNAASAQFQNSVALTPTHFFVDLDAHLQSAIEQCDHLGKFLDQTLKNSSPSLLSFRQVLVEISEWTGHILAAREQEAPTGDLDSQPEMEPAEERPAGIETLIRNRWEAYRMLSEAADYLARTEPHSPVPYLVRRAVLWGNMDLEQLLNEVVRNDSERKEIFRLLQIPDSNT